MYVGDLVITGSIQEAIMKFTQQITANYECKVLGELDRILNMEVTQTAEGVIPYVKDVLAKLKQYSPATGSKFNGAETPMEN